MSPPPLTDAYFVIRLAETLRKRHPEWTGQRCFDSAAVLIQRAKELWSDELDRRGTGTGT